MYHSFETSIAKEYGMLEAVLIQNFMFWIAKNEANEIHFHDGRYWTYNTQKALLELFPYASKRKLETAISHLKEAGIIITGNYNSSAYDHTMWYAFSDYGKSIVQKCEIDFTNQENRCSQNVKTIPDSNTDINTDIKRESILTDAKEKRPHRPTVDEVKAYCEEAQIDIEAERFVDYYESQGWIKSNGRPVINWKATVRTWARRDKETAKKQQYSTVPDDFDIVAYNEEQKRLGYI